MSSTADDDNEEEEGTDSDSHSHSHSHSHSNNNNNNQQTPPPPPPPPPPLPLTQTPTANQNTTDDSRRLFQRLWTDEEELLILRGFLDFTSRRGTTFASHQYDTGPFYEEIRRQLSFDFSKNQLIEKLRRLKKKYRTCAHRMHAAGPGKAKFAFRSAHEQAIYDVARQIWPPGLNKKDGDDDDDDEDLNPNVTANVNDSVLTPATHEKQVTRSTKRRVRRRTMENLETPQMPPVVESVIIVNENAVPVNVATMENSVPETTTKHEHVSVSSFSGVPAGGVEETMRIFPSPLFKEMIGSAVGAVPREFGIGSIGELLGLNPLGPMKIEGILGGLVGGNEGDKWRQQQILELEVYLKRIELVREQVTATLEELRSSGG